MNNNEILAPETQSDTSSAATSAREALTQEARTLYACPKTGVIVNHPRDCRNQSAAAHLPDLRIG